MGRPCSGCPPLGRRLRRSSPVAKQKCVEWYGPNTDLFDAFQHHHAVGSVRAHRHGDVAPGAFRRQSDQPGKGVIARAEEEIPSFDLLFDRRFVELRKCLERVSGDRHSSASAEFAAVTFSSDKFQRGRGNGFQPIQRTTGSLRGTGGDGAFGRPAMIGATGAQAAGSPSTAFPSGVFRKLWAKPIQQVPSPAAYAASIRFSAANAQSSTIQGPSAIAEIKISTGA